MCPATATTALPSAPPVDRVAAIKRAWRDGDTPDAARAFREDPELLRFRSLVVDLAYEDYCLREEAGQTPEAEAFCQEIPVFRSQIREVIRGHRLLCDHAAELAAAPPVWPEPGAVFEDLTIVRELGRGAFARAFLAHDPGTDTSVALKLSPTPSCEGRTLGRIDHPHVVRVRWAKQIRGLYAVCMPFVSVTTLRDVIDAAFIDPASPPRSARAILDTIEGMALSSEQCLPPDPSENLSAEMPYAGAVAAMAAPLADALAHVHRRGIAHGDLKPSNVLLAAGGRPYLIDFNLSRRHDDALQSCGGTLPYMAPEVVRVLLRPGENAGMAPQADVYAFGAMLWETLTGRVPLEPRADLDERAAVAELLVRQTTDAARPVLADPLVPELLAVLINRCLAIDPADRPTALDIKAELEAYLRPPTPPVTGWRRRRLMLTGLSLAAILGGVGLGVGPSLSRLLSPKETESPAAAPELVPQIPRTHEEFVRRGLASLRNGDHVAANSDFARANKLEKRPETLALQGYCFAQLEQLHTSEGFYVVAIQLGHRPAWVRNNLAYCLLRRPTKKVNLYSHIIAEFNEILAADFDPALQRCARYNRALAYYELAELTGDTQHLTIALQDIEAVIATGECSSDLFFHGAVINTAAGPEHHDRAVECLTEAVKRGRVTRNLDTDRRLVPLREKPTFQRLILNPPLPSVPDMPRNLRTLGPPELTRP